MATLFRNIWVAIVVGYCLAQVVRGMASPSVTDFGSVFRLTALSLVEGHRNLYCNPCLAASIRSTFHETSIAYTTVFANPPLAAYLLVAFALLPAELSLRAFECLSLWAVGIAIFLIHRRVVCNTTLPVLEVCSALITLPSAETFTFAQWDGLLLLAVVSALLVGMSRPYVTGLLLSILLIKPQVIWVVPMFLICIGNWRVLWGFAVGALGWAISSLLLVPPYALASLMHNLTIVAGEGMLKELSLSSLAEIFDIHLSLLLVLSIATIGLVSLCAVTWRYRMICRSHPELLLACGIVASCLLSPHLLPADVMVVGVAFVIALASDVPYAKVAVMAINIAFCCDTVLPVRFAHCETLVLVAFLFFLYIHVHTLHIRSLVTAHALGTVP